MASDRQCGLRERTGRQCDPKDVGNQVIRVAVLSAWAENDRKGVSNITTF